MKIVVRCIYNKPVTPSCDIIDMDDETWREFLHVVRRRKELVLQILGRENLSHDIREIAWIPLDNQDKVGIIEEGKVIKLARTMHLTPKRTYTKEEVLKFRSDTYRRMRQLGAKEDEARAELKMDEKPDMEHWNEIMQSNSPESWAELLMM